MKKQDYSNHSKYYAPHHFIFYPIALALTAGSSYHAYKLQSCEWAFIALAFVLLIWLSLMLRQHYALGLQNRVVRLEMRLRYYQLTQQRFEDIETQLSFGQIAALRFASDKELPSLVQKTLVEKLSSNAIKKSIVNWYTDDMRV